ncbi:MFS family transporter [Methylobacterium nigriterrae]|uniref:MFS family transporter n=1 Tax=Methylobacterium nigriterrae TaxID=3127512 RepID=UPI003013B41A
MAESAIIGGTTDLSEAEKHTPRSRIASIAGACAGNLVEWYDFFVYAYTSIYFAAAFFPAGDQTTQLLATAAVFAVGFFMRPLGGWLFGYIADTKGRKISMIISVAMMCAGSQLIACLPTYGTIGFAAPALLILARLVQGLSVGAEYGTGATYLAEVAGPGRRAFYGSFQYFTIIAGQLLALLTVTALQHLLSAEDLKAWGWRIPFVIGALGAIVVSVLRRSMHETATAKSMHRKEAGSIKGLMRHKRAVLLVLAITMGGSLYFYTFTTYMQKFLVLSAGFSATTVSFIMTSAMVCYMVAQPIFGLLSDKIGIKRSMLLYSTCAVVLVVPILLSIQFTRSPLVAFSLVLAGLLIASFYTPIAGLVKAELFPAEVRALGVGLPYAIANAMFGGTAEYVALSLRTASVEQYFFFYVAFINGMVLLASIALPHLDRHGYLDGDGEIEARTGFRSARG